MAPPSQYQLPSASPLQRSISASAAFLIILAALSVFQFKPQHNSHQDTQHESQLIWFQLAAPVPSQTPPPQTNTAHAKSRPTKKIEAQAISTENIPAPAIATESPKQEANKNDFDDAFKSEKAIALAITTKRAGIDGSSIQRAYQDSKTDIEKQAEKSGKSLTDARLTQQEKFQQAANRAAKPDCLRQGTSLLSLFVVAYQVATDHCK